MVDVSVVLCPEQIVVLPIITGTGIGFTVIVAIAEAVAPVLSIAVTVYVVVDVGQAVMIVPLAPGLQI